VVIAVPRSLQFLSPQPLQVGRKSTSARGTDEEIAAILKEECSECGVFGTGVGIGIGTTTGTTTGAITGERDEAGLGAALSRWTKIERDAISK